MRGPGFWVVQPSAQRNSLCVRRAISMPQLNTPYDPDPAPTSLFLEALLRWIHLHIFFEKAREPGSTIFYLLRDHLSNYFAWEV